jgi:glycogen operon protein
VTQRYATSPGRFHPPGAIPDGGGVNFAVFCRNATAVQLLLFERADSVQPTQVIDLDRDVNKTYVMWHVYVHGLRPGAHYAYRVDGPQDLHGCGHRYDPSKVLVDPYSRGVTTALWCRGDAAGPGDNLATSMRSVVLDVGGYDWEGDRPLNRPLRDSIIYEMHVGGFTRHPSSGARHPGTFTGVAEKVDYLKQLGVTAVELLPVMSFEDKEAMRPGPDGRPLRNYWGYSTLGFFSPEDGYCVDPGGGQQLREFRDMVKALHRAGIEVILDVVFNHTDEGGADGPAYSFKGFANEVYYHLVPGDRRSYVNYTGCGNTLRCNNPIVMRFILDCLLYWVKEMHVDGFRFDLASVLTRGEDGSPLAQPPVIYGITLLESLVDTKVIAEAWDAAGLYQVGEFPGFRWSEWNGRYRDDVRRFVRGDPGLIGAVAARLAGSADLYGWGDRLPANSVNFVTCHDGFTLNDLVSYNDKHNEANGEHNNDGANDNNSWNCGAEGPTDDPNISALRERQVKNFAAILLLSQGVPMILMGDEVRRSQRGNNNAYCQDNEVSWLDWGLVEQNAGLLRFWRRLIDFRKRHASLRRKTFFTGKGNERGLRDVTWHGCRLNDPGWDDPNARALAFTLAGVGGEEDIHVLLNMYWGPLDFDLPVLDGRGWHLAVDTAEDAPLDAAEPGQEKRVTGGSFSAQGRSVVVLVSRGPDFIV